jgi:hypothetical protein
MYEFKHKFLGWVQKQYPILLLLVMSRGCTVLSFSKGEKGVKGLWCLMPLSTIFQLYHGSQTCRKSLTNFIT